jgi:hypothetical protein
MTCLQNEEIAAQRLVCTLLVSACERAHSEPLCALGEASRPAEVRTGLRAAESLKEVLAGWREALAVVAVLEAGDEAAGLLDGNGARMSRGFTGA